MGQKESTLDCWIENKDNGWGCNCWTLVSCLCKKAVIKGIHSHVFNSWLHPMAILGTVGMNGPLWTVVRNALSVGFSNASPFFSGGTKHCCEGRMIRINTHVPARSHEIIPSWRETVLVLCCCQCVCWCQHWHRKLGWDCLSAIWNQLPGL